MSHDAHANHKPHIIPLWVYLAVFGALLFLTVLTVAAAYVDLGFMNMPIALGIATVKAALVAMFFMHLLYDEKFNLIVFLTALLFLMVFMTFTMLDPITRGVHERIEKNINVTPPALIRGKVPAHGDHAMPAAHDATAGDEGATEATQLPAEAEEPAAH